MNRRSLFAGLAALAASAIAGPVAAKTVLYGGPEDGRMTPNIFTGNAMPAHTHDGSVAVPYRESGVWVPLNHGSPHSHDFVWFEEPIHQHAVRLL